MIFLMVIMKLSKKNYKIMTLKFTDLIQPNYERVLLAQDELSGFHSIVAIHNTNRGPALGWL